MLIRLFLQRNTLISQLRLSSVELFLKIGFDNSNFRYESHLLNMSNAFAAADNKKRKDLTLVM